MMEDLCVCEFYDGLNNFLYVVVKVYFAKLHPFVLL